MTKVNEKFEHFNGLSWTRGKTRTRIYQSEGMDIVITQKSKDRETSMWSYSEPGYHLFYGMLKYQQEHFGRLSPFEEIEHVLGNQSTFNARGYLVENELIVEEPRTTLAHCQDGKVRCDRTQREHFVGAYMGLHSYVGFIEDKNFITAASPPQTKSDVTLITGPKEKPFETPLERMIILKPDDALRVMKTVYYYAGDKIGLKEFYEQFREEM